MDRAEQLIQDIKELYKIQEPLLKSWDLEQIFLKRQELKKYGKQYNNMNFKSE